MWAVVTRQKSLNELPPCVEALVTGRRHAEWPTGEAMTLYGLLWVAASFCAFLAI
ncbi:hypothetical protein SAMN04244575_06279, partial [Sinorhizobium meliloti]